MTSSKLKLLSAGVGAAGVLTMAGVSMMHNSVVNAEPEPAPPGPVTSTPISTGETVTDEEAPPSPETSVATPEVTVTTTVPEVP